MNALRELLFALPLALRIGLVPADAADISALRSGDELTIRIHDLDRLRLRHADLRARWIGAIRRFQPR